MRSLTIRTILGLAAAFALCSFVPQQASAQTLLPSPSSLPGLSLGDTYRFVFVTSGTTASSTAGSTFYNNFVQTAANSVSIGTSLGLTWKAIVSTGTQASPTSALTNAPVSATTKVYLLNGTQVANGGTNPFYSGSANHLVAMNFSEIKTTVNRNVWTGGNAAGSESGSGLLGQPADGNGPVYGYSGGTLAAAGDPNSWSRVGNNGNGNFGSAYSLYAVSGPLTYTASVTPEPGTLALTVAFCVVGSGFFVRRRKK